VVVVTRVFTDSKGVPPVKSLAIRKNAPRASVLVTAEDEPRSPKGAVPPAPAAAPVALHSRAGDNDEDNHPEEKNDRRAPKEDSPDSN
jgi:hypothetical protein